MILRSIRLEDFGLYAGITELDLIPRRRKSGVSPIVLIGGKNGAGKTTLLEAVRLALYGRRALGARVAQVDYDAYLRSRINRGAHVRAAAVALEFDYAEAGVVHRYRVRREWAVRGKSVVESLLLDKDGAAVVSVPREEWHQFLQELIPPGVSQLFFFDGEKIREIADGEEDNEQLAQAVRGLLGIELVGRLRTDLGLYLARHQREEDGSIAGRVESAVRDITIMERRITVLADEVAELTSARESQARAAEQIRRRFVAEGGDAATHRAATEAAQDEVRRGIARTELELRDMANRLLPFAMAPKLVGRFRVVLSQDEAGTNQRSSIRAARDAVKKWRTDGKTMRRAAWSATHWADLNRFLDEWKPASSKSDRLPILGDIGDREATLARLTEIESLIRPRASALLDEMDTLVRRKHELETALARADNAAAGVMLDELRLADEQVGATEAILKSKQEELRTLRGQLVTLERERKRFLDEQASAATAANRAILAGRTAQVLADYEQRLLEHKLIRLRAEFVGRFNHLARKGDLIADVQIDPTTFAATLIDRSGQEVPKTDLSAGEKQVYAIAMLWALARTSGRPLPMIIDTPLARLDSDHRANLVERYFPAASHQVILLSTDTEVDLQLLEGLGTSVSHAYRLDYDPKTGSTTASRGYFEDEGRMKGGRRALQQA